MPVVGESDSTRSPARRRPRQLRAGQEQAAPATTSKSTKISTQRYSRRQCQHASHRRPVCGSRFARQCCAWQSEGCVSWRSWCRCRWCKRWRSNDLAADVQARALQCAHVQRHEFQGTQRAACSARGLTLCSTGHLAAARAWPSFHSGPSAVCRKAPVNTNVRPRRNAKP